MTQLDIKSIAIIGGGPGGLAALYEFLHTDKNGNSTAHGDKPAQQRFDEIVVFEQKDKAGGIWATSIDEADLPVPPQELLDTEQYNDPDVIHPAQAIPDGIERATYADPIIKEGSKLVNELEWRRSGVYPDLYTNIPSRFIRFSYLPNEEKYRNKDRKIYPFLSHRELSRRIDEFVEKENLNDNIRFNTRVERVGKNDAGKWVVTVREKANGSEKWYQQQFDAVLVANGHYTVPNIPQIPGLAEFNKKHPGTVVHAKSYRRPDAYEGKRVVIIGNSFSTVNLVQYLYPVAKETIVSKRGPHLVFGWINDGLSSEGLVSKPEIASIDADKRELTFKDGSVVLDVDHIFLTTGYHYHLPFLSDHLKVVDPSNLSRVGGLYYQTFSIDDPTLAAVGVAVSAINFHTIEASAAAIAGVWSNAKLLPPKEEQQAWEKETVEKVGNNLFFHFYPHPTIREDFVDRLHQFAPHGRKNPLADDGEHLDEIDLGIALLEKLFYKLKTKEISIADTRYDE